MHEWWSEVVWTAQQTLSCSELSRQKRVELEPKRWNEVPRLSGYDLVVSNPIEREIGRPNPRSIDFIIRSLIVSTHVLLSPRDDIELRRAVWVRMMRLAYATKRNSPATNASNLFPKTYLVNQLTVSKTNKLRQDICCIPVRRPIKALQNSGQVFPTLKHITLFSRCQPTPSDYVTLRPWTRSFMKDFNQYGSENGCKTTL